jgi:hypothetical protein
MRKLITFIDFWIGVNVIGIPEIHTHDLKQYFIYKSKYFK